MIYTQHSCALQAGSSSDTLRGGPVLSLPGLEANMKQVADSILTAAAGGSLDAYRHRHVFHACHKLRAPSGKPSLTSAVSMYPAVYVLTALQSSIECRCCTACPSLNNLVFDYIQCIMTSPKHCLACVCVSR